MRTTTTALPSPIGFQMGMKVANARGCAIGCPKMRRRKVVGAGGLGMRMMSQTTTVASETGRGRGTAAPPPLEPQLGVKVLSRRPSPPPPVLRRGLEAVG
jgi:hypothetical protein